MRAARELEPQIVYGRRAGHELPAGGKGLVLILAATRVQLLAEVIAPKYLAGDMRAR